MAVSKMEASDILAILKDRVLGRLGCIVEGTPYVVPVNYYFDGNDVYIHSLPGRKIDALRANPHACLQVDEIRDAYHWHSVIVYGRYDEILDEARREQVLADLFKRLPHLSPVESRMTWGKDEIIVFRLRVSEISGVREDWS